MEFNQLDKPQKGDLIATMETSMGDIKIRLFKDKAPKAVENFATHAKNGYYEGITFHRVMNDFMIQGGDPTGTGMAGESIWGAPFEDEFDEDLSNYRGALSMANSGPGTNGSQFFIVQAGPVDEGMLGQMEAGGFPADITANYAKIGGTPWLDGRHTVFGQVFEGIETVDTIARQKTNPQDKPLSDITINKITITEAE